MDGGQCVRAKRERGYRAEPHRTHTLGKNPPCPHPSVSQTCKRYSLLTRCERKVLRCVADGLSNRMIGERLQIRPRTVEIQRTKMLNKIGTSRRGEAIRIAIEVLIVA